VDNKNWYLAIDQGGHASRAIVFDHGGQVIQAAFRPLATQTFGEDRVEHDPHELVESVKQSVTDVLAALGKDAVRVKAAGLATQRSSIVCWHRETGEALSPVISWQDRRASELLAPLDDMQKVRQRTGLFVNAHYGASKLKWCLQHLPNVRAAYQSNQLVMGPLASFVIRRCCDQSKCVVDPANASRTLLMDYQTASWDRWLCQQMDIDMGLLPTIVPTQFSYGTIRSQGLSIPLEICTGDQSAAIFCQGVPSKGHVHINVGTGAFLQCVFSDQTNVSPRLLNSVVYWDTTQRMDVIEGTVNGAGSALQWGAEQFSIDIATVDFVACDRENNAVPIFINGISGLGSPYWRSQQNSYFVEPGNVSQNMLAILESIVFLMAKNWEYFLQSIQVERVFLSGGVTRWEAFCQRFANLCGVSVYRYADTEATARGVAYLVAEQPSNWYVSELHEFKPQQDLALQARYWRWQTHMGHII